MGKSRRTLLIVLVAAATMAVATLLLPALRKTPAPMYPEAELGDPESLGASEPATDSPPRVETEAEPSVEAEAPRPAQGNPLRKPVSVIISNWALETAVRHLAREAGLEVGERHPRTIETALQYAKALGRTEEEAKLRADYEPRQREWEKRKKAMQSAMRDMFQPLPRPPDTPNSLAPAADSGDSH